MIDKILEFSVRQRVLVLMGALALLLVGLWSATKLPMDAIPDITGVQVQVNTTVPALAPDEVEKLVTVPLEMALGGVAGVTEMRSLSRLRTPETESPERDALRIEYAQSRGERQ